jgi:hypothetical protein
VRWQPVSPTLMNHLRQHAAQRHAAPAQQLLHGVWPPIRPRTWASDLPKRRHPPIRLQVEHLPGDRDPMPVRLWISITGAASAGVDRSWQDSTTPV